MSDTENKDDLLGWPSFSPQTLSAALAKWDEKHSVKVNGRYVKRGEAIPNQETAREWAIRLLARE